MAKYTEATAEGFITYHETRGREIPGTAEPEAIEAALLVASEWIDHAYGPSFIGWKKDGFLQELEWPRTNAVVNTSIPPYVFPDNAIPQRVINAVYEAAYRQLITPGSLLKDYTPNKYESVSIDGAVSVKFAGITTAADIQATFPAIDAMLLPLMDLAAGFSSYSSSSVRA